jgi:HK97 gp10 family phage protein
VSGLTFCARLQVSDSFEFDQSLKLLMQSMDALPARIEANLIRGALRAAAKPVFETAKANIPMSSGDLKASLRISSAIKKKAGEIVVSVKAGGKKAFYAHMVEMGTARHFIKGPVSIGGKVMRNIDHPGAAAKPFMRPAFDAMGQASVDAYARYIEAKLPAALEKHRGAGDGGD